MRKRRQNKINKIVSITKRLFVGSKLKPPVIPKEQVEVQITERKDTPEVSSIKFI